MEKVIKNVIYTDNNEPMNYIDIENEECKEFIQAIENMSKEIDKLKLEIQQKDIMEVGKTITDKKEKEKRIENALLYLKTMEETEDTYELEKILKGE